jgi:hypothetical protein
MTHRVHLRGCAVARYDWLFVILSAYLELQTPRLRPKTSASRTSYRRNGKSLRLAPRVLPSASRFLATFPNTPSLSLKPLLLTAFSRSSTWRTRTLSRLPWCPGSSCDDPINPPPSLQQKLNGSRGLPIAHSLAASCTWPLAPVPTSPTLWVVYPPSSTAIARSIGTPPHVSSSILKARALSLSFLAGTHPSLSLASPTRITPTARHYILQHLQRASEIVPSGPESTLRVLIEAMVKDAVRLGYLGLHSQTAEFVLPRQLLYVSAIQLL